MMSHLRIFLGGFLPSASQLGTRTNTSLKALRTPSRLFPKVTRPATCTSRLTLAPVFSEARVLTFSPPRVKEGFATWASKDSTSKRGVPWAVRRLW